MLRVSASAGGLGDALKAQADRVDSGIATALKDTTQGLQDDLRQQTAAVLGSKVSNAWRSRYYPNQGDLRGPAGFVWSKAPRILQFFSADRVVTPLGQAFAIPVNPVIKRRGRKATVAEVEQEFGPLQAVPLKDGNLGLFATLARTPGGRLRSPKGSAAKRSAQKVLMFVLVRSIRSVKLVDIEATASLWGNRFADMVGASLGGSAQ